MKKMQNPAEDAQFKIFIVVSCGFRNINESFKFFFKVYGSSLKQGLAEIHELHDSSF
jgi:hypothetical protein